MIGPQIEIKKGGRRKIDRDLQKAHLNKSEKPHLFTQHPLIYIKDLDFNVFIASPKITQTPLSINIPSQLFIKIKDYQFRIPK